MLAKNTIKNFAGCENAYDFFEEDEVFLVVL